MSMDIHRIDHRMSSDSRVLCSFVQFTFDMKLVVRIVYLFLFNLFVLHFLKNYVSFGKPIRKTIVSNIMKNQIFLTQYKNKLTFEELECTRGPGSDLVINRCLIKHISRRYLKIDMQLNFTKPVY